MIYPILVTSGAAGSGQLAYATSEHLSNFPKKSGCNPTKEKRACERTNERTKRRRGKIDDLNR